MRRQMSYPTTLYAVAWVIVFAGCGGSNYNGGGVPGESRDLAFSWSGPDDGGVTAIDAGAPDLVVSSSCPESAKLVYVVDENNMFSSFKPDLLQFIDIGTLNCPARRGATPFSMAIDRTAVAWVLYSSGEIFKVDTTNAKCTGTPYSPGQRGFDQFGMGFAANAQGSNDETLYIAGPRGFFGGGGLGAIDTRSLVVTRIANLGGSPELTGTGSGTLWGFFPEGAMPRVAQIDKSQGTESNVFSLHKLAGTPRAWAFAFWGGDFWIFLKRVTDGSTRVWQLRQTGELTTAIGDSQRTIVGAAVSTCAPIGIQ